MARPGHNIHIPLSEGEAVSLLGRVKPAADMPRQGSHPTKANRKKTATPGKKRNGKP